MIRRILVSISQGHLFFYLKKKKKNVCYVSQFVSLRVSDEINDSKTRTI